MLRRKEYRDRVVKTLNFEGHIYTDFEKLCMEERVYPSHKLQELMIEVLEKKVEGEPNPLNLQNFNKLYNSHQEKPSQLTLEMWLAQVHGAKDNESLLAIYEGQASKVMVTARNLRQQAFRRRILKR